MGKFSGVKLKSQHHIQINLSYLYYTRSPELATDMNTDILNVLISICRILHDECRNSLLFITVFDLCPDSVPPCPYLGESGFDRARISRGTHHVTVFELLYLISARSKFSIIS